MFRVLGFGVFLFFDGFGLYGVFLLFFFWLFGLFLGFFWVFLRFGVWVQGCWCFRVLGFCGSGLGFRFGLSGFASPRLLAG